MTIKTGQYYFHTLKATGHTSENLFCRVGSSKPEIQSIEHPHQSGQNCHRRDEGQDELSSVFLNERERESTSSINNTQQTQSHRCAACHVCDVWNIDSRLNSLLWNSEVLQGMFHDWKRTHVHAHTHTWRPLSWIHRHFIARKLI